ncbi:MAG: 16S rRNA (uracil(1498)-N(3))-methyltransferase [Anaerolineales bacterium]|nr:16S rRNA (uracil(1498)-N(3))-methyltransferase [Anaerolineales bacterium]
MHRFFIPHPTGYEVDQQLTFPNETAHQLVHVLRLRAGNRVVVLDDAGGLYEVTLTAVSRHRVTGQILTRRPARGEPSVKITLYQSLTRREKFEWVLQKGTEVGVVRFVPIVTQRSLVQETAVKPQKLARWQKIATEAAEQSHRGMVPTVSQPLLFQDALQAAQQHDLRLIASVTESESLHLLLSRHSNIRQIGLFIGPEGGFSEDEVENGRHHNAIPISLGSRVLRTETAAIVACANIIFQCDA